jgi:hypothetical protein
MISHLKPMDVFPLNLTMPHFHHGTRDGCQFLFEAARKGLDWFEDASHGKAHPQSDGTILEVRPVGDYDNVHYLRVGTVRERRRCEFWTACITVIFS